MAGIRGEESYSDDDLDALAADDLEELQQTALRVTQHAVAGGKRYVHFIHQIHIDWLIVCILRGGMPSRLRKCQKLSIFGLWRPGRGGLRGDLTTASRRESRQHCQ
jgi:hypothetical protein